MRRILLASLIVASLLTAPTAVAEAQRAMIGQTTVRANARLVMPEILILRPVADAVASWAGTAYTEYQLRYTLGANTSWTLEATALPTGVSLLAEDGFYRDGNVVAARGGPTNLGEHIVRVRVSENAPDSWEMQLRMELRGAREAR